MKTFLKQGEYYRELFVLSKMKEKLKTEMRAVAADPYLSADGKKALRMKMLRDFSFPMIVGNGKTKVRKWSS